ncbi:hypothetical protein [Conexibacter sp. CPCC 206217]|uniref:hypothetical protein n=1 Tax=Conexibacter sp. CPCC 206217 TaxID=3064574 RepID=UPI002726D8F9|nr:hypothetical protein [Conexibacter sp. CPCC 206217]MDO8212397.1 hypothetical protein [Conexibacter sp. CPCC 206217]
MLSTSRTLALGLAILTTAAVPATALAKHGADDGPNHDAGDDHGGRGGDDRRGDDNGGRRGGDDNGGGNRGRKLVVGSCTDGSTAKLKVKPDDGRLEAEFEVDQNRSGVTWNVVLRRNGRVAVSTRATTNARSGSFSVERKLADGSGRDRVSARATSPSGEVCSAALTI